MTVLVEDIRQIAKLPPQRHKRLSAENCFTATLGSSRAASCVRRPAKLKFLF